MNPTYVPALAALAGSAIGALASFATTWLTQSYQDHMQRAAQESSRRERIFGEFIDQASKSYVDLLVNPLEDPTKLVSLYATIGKLRLFASERTIATAEEVMRRIIETYRLPPAEDRASRITKGKGAEVDVPREFVAACRVELMRK